MEKWEEKVEAIRRIKSEKRIKDSRLFEVVEEVFDYPTLMALYHLIRTGVIRVVHGAVASGKEARIYWAEGAEGDLAVKIFLVVTAEFRRGRLKYIEGDPRFKRVGRRIRDIVRAWCSKEYRNLLRAYKAGVRVPKPYAYRENVLVMEFISGSERGRPAPLLKETSLSNPAKAFSVIKDYIERLYRDADLVHADLSEYNIMVRDDELIIIDWGSAVLVSHPHALEFLARDIRNVIHYFRRLGVDTGDPREFFRELTGEDPSLYFQ